MCRIVLVNYEDLSLQCKCELGAFLCPFSDLQTTWMALLHTRLPVQLTVIQEGMGAKLEEEGEVEVTLEEEGVGYQVSDRVAVWNEHVPSYW